MQVKTKYKVLNENMLSPFKGFKFELGKSYRCTDFDDDKTKECAKGFYATDIDGIIYSYRKGRKVFECEVWGNSVEIGQYKCRYEYQKLIREIPEAELRELVYFQSQKMDWNYFNAVFPINPLELPEVKKVTDSDIELVKEWTSVGDSVWDSVWASVWDSVRASVGDSVWASVGDSVRASVGDSVWDSVGDSVRASVGDSVWDSVRASVYGYIASLFPNIKKWEYIDKESPYGCIAKLWHRGLVPSFDGIKWRLHTGKDAKIVWEGTM